MALAQDIEIQFNLRPQQREIWDNLKRFNVLVCHRRFGKTVLVIMRLLERALTIDTKRHGRPQFFYLAPTYKQASAIAFPILVDYASTIPGTEINRSELRVTLHNGAIIRLYGTDNGADHLRGLYADGLVIDETALISEESWNMVLRPMLADRRGWVIMIGTPMGRQNLFYQMYEHARITPHWFRALYKASDTDLLHPDELADMKRMLRPAVYEQEMECSWDAAILGAFYRNELKTLYDDGRLSTVAYDNTLPVYAGVDIGYGDLMVYVIFQKRGNTINIIDCQAFEQTSIPDQHAILQKLDWAPTKLLLPHDAQVHEVGSGKTRKEIWTQLGYSCNIVPRHQVHDGIEAVRTWLSRVTMDQERCKTLYEALLAYRTEYDDVKRVHKTSPMHDWSSHYADAVRYCAVGEANVGSGFRKIDYSEVDRAVI